MHVIRFIFLFIVAVNNVLASGLSCGDNYPEFNIRPEVKVERESDSSTNIFVLNNHEGLAIQAMNLTISVKRNDSMEYLVVPLAYQIEGELAVANLTSFDMSMLTNLKVTIKYTDHLCGPNIEKEFNLLKLKEQDQHE